MIERSHGLCDLEVVKEHIKNMECDVKNLRSNLNVPLSEYFIKYIHLIQKMFLDLITELEESRKEVEKWKLEAESAIAHADDFRAEIDRMQYKNEENRKEVERLNKENLFMWLGLNSIVNQQYGPVDPIEKARDILKIVKELGVKDE